MVDLRGSSRSALAGEITAEVGRLSVALSQRG
jgi:hypothetical protein